jgi:hypothetical protein
VVVLVAACTRPNAGFEGGEASTADEQGEVGQEGEGTTTAGGGTTRGSADTTDASDTRATTSGELETTANVTSEATLGSSGDASESGGTGSCTPPADPYEIDVMPPLLALPFLECQFGPTVRNFALMLDVQSGPSTFSAQLCSEKCVCEGFMYQLSFNGPVPVLPQAPQCFQLLVELSPTDQETCMVSAYMLQGESVQLTMASNVRDPAALGMPVDVALGGVEPCEGCKDPPSGSYALEAVGGVSIPPGATGDAGGFTIHNAGAVIDENCNAVVRWSAMAVEMGG